MKLEITVKPGSKKIGIEKNDETHWTVRVHEPPVDGKANQAVIKAISKELGIAKSKIQIIRGESSRIKLLEIDI